MSDVPLGALFGALVVLLLLSAFFSASETGMMALNRYRTKHLAESGHRGARLALTLLNRPDRLLGTILLGNNLVNNAAAVVSTLIALRLFGEAAIAIATGIITLLILVLSEIPPKTIAAYHPERIAYPAAYVLTTLQWLAHPVVWFVNLLGSFVPRLLGIPMDRPGEDLSLAELRTLVKQSGRLIPESHQQILLRILELEDMTVEDVMLPRTEIEALDLDEDWDDLLEQMATAHHTRLPVYRGELDNIVGELHLRDVLHLSYGEGFDKEALESILKRPFFIPEGSRLIHQLLALRDQRRQMGLVVDEYGDIIGLVTLDEILEEIVGEFTTHVPGIDEDVHVEEDGSYLIDGSATIRDLNRQMGWQLPTDGPKTLNGLLLEYLEEIPRPGTSVKIAGMVFEVVQARGTAINVVRIRANAVTVDDTEVDNRS
jgi:Mg2+/Co2+ transporter CorB